MDDELVEEPGDVGRDRLFVMLGREERRDLARIGRLVVARLLKRDRERLDGPIGRLRHHGHDGARVDAARQERAERHVRHHLRAHRTPERFPKLLDPLAVTASVDDLDRRAPVGPRLHLAVLHRHRVRRRELFHAFEDRKRSDDELVGQETIERFRVQHARNLRTRQERFDLGSKNDVFAGAAVVIVKRLLPCSVARGQKTPAGGVPECEGELTVHPLGNAVAPLFVAVDDDLHVRPRPEAVTFA